MIRSRAVPAIAAGCRAFKRPVKQRRPCRAARAGGALPLSDSDQRMEALAEQFQALVSTDPQPQIILGTQSASRRAILDKLAARFDFKYSSITADIDELAIKNDLRGAGHAQQLVLALAHAKADAIVDKLKQSDALVTPGYLVTCDQVVVFDGRIREKPASEAEAREFIQSYANGPAETVGACVCVCLQTGRQFEDVDFNKAHIGKLSEEVVDSLIEEGEVFKCAGGLMIEHKLVQQHVRSIEGTMDGIMGLSQLSFVRVILKTADTGSMTFYDLQ